MLENCIAEHLFGLPVTERLRAPARVQWSIGNVMPQLHSSGLMHDSPQQLRRQADHCRDLASGLVDERTRLILNGMA